MACTKVLSGRDARQVTALLCLPEIADLDETRWTGRPGYPIRVMVGAALVKAVYAPPSAPLPGRQRRVIGVTWEEYQAQQQTETEQPPRVRDQRL